MAHGGVDDVRRAKRILCFGATGSGKTTLARELSSRLSLPLILVDDILWDPDWTQLDAAEQNRRLLPLLATESYVIDSVYRPQNAAALDSVDVIVAIDSPRVVSLARVLRRTMRRIATRERVCNGNVETLGRALSRDSVIAWHFRSWASKRERIRRWHADADAPPVVTVRNQRETNALLAALGRASLPPKRG